MSAAIGFYLAAGGQTGSHAEAIAPHAAAGWRATGQRHEFRPSCGLQIDRNTSWFGFCVLFSPPLRFGRWVFYCCAGKTCHGMKGESVRYPKPVQYRASSTASCSPGCSKSQPKLPREGPAGRNSTYCGKGWTPWARPLTSPGCTYGRSPRRVCAESGCWLTAPRRTADCSTCTAALSAQAARAATVLSPPGSQKSRVPRCWPWITG
jgi:hypothetical protein